MQDLNSRHDPVYQPAHYTAGKIEVWDFIADQRLNFCLGNVVKYVCRCDRKGNAIEDLEKAVRYLQKELSERRKNPDCRDWDRMRAEDERRTI